MLDDAVGKRYVVTHKFLNQGTYISPQHSRFIRAIAENLRVRVGLSNCHWHIEMV